MEFSKGPLRGSPAEQLVSVALAAEIHPFPFRTRKLSPPAPMVLGWIRPGRVGRRRFLTHASLTSVRLAVFLRHHALQSACAVANASGPRRAAVPRRSAVSDQV